MLEVKDSMSKKKNKKTQNTHQWKMSLRESTERRKKTEDKVERILHSNNNKENKQV